MARAKLSLTHDAINERYEKGLKLEACGLTPVQIGRQLGYANPYSWGWLKKIQTLKKKSAAIAAKPVQLAIPVQEYVKKPTAGEKLARLLGITEQELDTILDLIKDCRRI